MKLSEIATFVEDIISSDIALEHHVTTEFPLLKKTSNVIQMKKYKLGEVATIEVSSVDKKTKEGETPISLCNFTDVYYNWAITKGMYQGFMRATANANEISRFILRKGQVALTKDSETRFDIGISSYIAEDFSDVILGYHCALITPDESKLDGRYLNAFLHSDMSRKYFANNASGSGQRYALTAQSVTDLPIWLPSLITQKRIGQLFSAIDRKIALNRAINHNLPTPVHSSGVATTRRAA